MEKLLLISIMNTKKKDLSYDHKAQAIVDQLELLYSKKPQANRDNHSRVIPNGKDTHRETTGTRGANPQRP